MKSIAAAIAATALAIGPAQANCWTAEDASAASVRELQSMLMVATLRCHAAGIEIADDYNAFVAANRGALMGGNERMKAHFIRAHGPVAGQYAYDGYVTAHANGYGAHASTPQACADAAAIGREARLMAGSVEGLVLIAERRMPMVELPGGRCDIATVAVAAAGTARGLAAAAQPVPDQTIAAAPAAAAPLLTAERASPASAALAAAAPAAPPPAATVTSAPAIMLIAVPVPAAAPGVVRVGP